MAVKSATTTIGHGDGASPEVFTNIGQVTALAIGGAQSELIDVTNLSSTAKEYLLDIPDSGEITVNGTWQGNDAEQQNMNDGVGGATAENYKITFADTTTADFAALIRGFDIDVGEGDAVRYTLTLKISGSVTWAYAV